MLGGQESISSLRCEVAALQAAMVTLTSKAGTVNTPSWKYPDKLSSEVDITELLDLYDYAEEDEQKSKIAHVVLLELIIDRYKRQCTLVLALNYRKTSVIWTPVCKSYHC